jgi:hypothetical protein
MVFVIFLILIKVDIPVRNRVILYLYHEIISEITLNNKTLSPWVDSPFDDSTDMLSYSVNKQSNLYYYQEMIHPYLLAIISTRCVRNRVILYLYHEIISEITLNNKTYVETL